MTRPRCDQTAAWTALQKSFEVSGKSFDLRAAFSDDPQRFAGFSHAAPHVFADLSKNLIDTGTQALLLDLARQCRLEEHRDAMFAGEPINGSEHRSVMHFLLRKPGRSSIFSMAANRWQAPPMQLPHNGPQSKD